MFPSQPARPAFGAPQTTPTLPEGLNMRDVVLGCLTIEGALPRQSWKERACTLGNRVFGRFVAAQETGTALHPPPSTLAPEIEALFREVSDPTTEFSLRMHAAIALLKAGKDREAIGHCLRVGMLEALKTPGCPDREIYAHDLQILGTSNATVQENFLDGLLADVSTGRFGSLGDLRGMLREVYGCEVDADVAIAAQCAGVRTRLANLPNDASTRHEVFSDLRKDLRNLRMHGDACELAENLIALLERSGQDAVRVITHPRAASVDGFAQDGRAA